MGTEITKWLSMALQRPVRRRRSGAIPSQTPYRSLGQGLSRLGGMHEDQGRLKGAVPFVVDAVCRRAARRGRPFFFFFGTCPRTEINGLLSGSAGSVWKLFLETLIELSSNRSTWPQFPFVCLKPRPRPAPARVRTRFCFCCINVFPWLQAFLLA